MRVAIDIGKSGKLDAIRGIGFHTKELVNHLKDIEALQLDLVDAKTTDLSKYDLVHYQSFPVYQETLPKEFQTKSVITIHDLIYLIYPQAYPAGIKGRWKFMQQKKRAKKADAIITISETSKKDIVRFLDIDPSKIYVTYLAPQSMTKVTTSLINQTKEKYNLPKEFVLYVGDVNYNKNILTLAKACKIAKLPLVMVGKQAVEQNFDRNHPENRSWVEFLKLYEYDPQVIRLGFLSNEEFSSVWKLASIYCQPSLYEGFGMTLLEAFQQQVPVVAARTQALVEVGADACMYVDPHNSEEFARAFKILLNKNVAQELVSKGDLRLKDFSWEKTAQQTYEIYKTVAK